MAYQVVIVEDQGLPRQFFCNIIENSSDYTLKKAFSSAEGVAEYCRANRISLVLMDVNLGNDIDGLTLAQQIKKESPEIRILAVTQMPEASFPERAKAIGVDSFCYKDTLGTSLLSVMDQTMQGKRVYPDGPLTVKIGISDSSCFSARELDVLRLMTTGISDAEIARKLGISYETVRTHIKHMTGKTGLSRMRLAIDARAAGIAIG